MKNKQHKFICQSCTYTLTIQYEVSPSFLWEMISLGEKSEQIWKSFTTYLSSVTKTLYMPVFSNSHQWLSPPEMPLKDTREIYQLQCTVKQALTVVILHSYHNMYLYLFSSFTIILFNCYTDNTELINNGIIK